MSSTLGAQITELHALSEHQLLLQCAGLNIPLTAAHACLTQARSDATANVTAEDIASSEPSDPESWGSVVKPTSPRSLLALARLGYSPEELRYKPPSAWEGKEDLRKIKHQEHEKYRKEKVNKLLRERRKVMEEEKHGNDPKASPVFTEDLPVAASEKSTPYSNTKSLGGTRANPEAPSPTESMTKGSGASPLNTSYDDKEREFLEQEKRRYEAALVHLVSSLFGMGFLFAFRACVQFNDCKLLDFAMITSCRLQVLEAKEEKELYQVLEGNKLQENIERKLKAHEQYNREKAEKQRREKERKERERKAKLKAIEDELERRDQERREAAQQEEEENIKRHRQRIEEEEKKRQRQIEERRKKLQQKQEQAEERRKATAERHAERENEVAERLRQAQDREKRREQMLRQRKIEQQQTNEEKRKQQQERLEEARKRSEQYEQRKREEYLRREAESERRREERKRKEEEERERKRKEEEERERRRKEKLEAAQEEERKRQQEIDEAHMRKEQRSKQMMEELEHEREKKQAVREASQERAQERLREVQRQQEYRCGIIMHMKALNYLYIPLVY